MKCLLILPPSLLSSTPIYISEWVGTCFGPILPIISSTFWILFKLGYDNFWNFIYCGYYLSFKLNNHYYGHKFSTILLLWAFWVILAILSGAVKRTSYRVQLEELIWLSISTLIFVGFWWHSHLIRVICTATFVQSNCKTKTQDAAISKALARAQKKHDFY